MILANSHYRLLQILLALQISIYSVCSMIYAWEWRWYTCSIRRLNVTFQCKKTCADILPCIRSHMLEHNFWWFCIFGIFYQSNPQCLFKKIIVLISRCVFCSPLVIHVAATKCQNGTKLSVMILLKWSKTLLDTNFISESLLWKKTFQTSRMTNFSVNMLVHISCTFSIWIVMVGILNVFV